MILTTRNAEYCVVNGVCRMVKQTEPCTPSHRELAIGMAIYGGSPPGARGVIKGILRIGFGVVFSDGRRVVRTSPLVMIRRCECTAGLGRRRVAPEMP